MDRRQLLMMLGAASAGLALPGCTPNGTAPLPLAQQRPDAVVPLPDGGYPVVRTPIVPFAAKLTQAMAPQTTNLIWSPWSVAMVLAMVRDGALGKTASELTEVLGAADDFDARLADGWRRMAHADKQPLRAANAVWVQQGTGWKQPFFDKLDALSATLKYADFRNGDPTGEINRWVGDHTAGKISQLLQPGMLTKAARMALVNALHFKAAWKAPLEVLGPRVFQTPTGEVQAPFIATPGSVDGYRGNGWRAALLPCEGREFALAVVQPDDRSAPLAPLAEAVLSAMPGGASGSRATEVDASVTMPVWKLRHRQLLNDLLIAAGMPTAFDTRAADFSGMTDEERLHVAFVQHEATIEVTATGIEASAATVAGMEAGSAPAPREHIELTLDRPFAYVLVHTPTGTPLFVGQVADPARETA